MSDEQPQHLPILDLPLVRAVEHAVGLPGVTVNRYFCVLWPLWRIEVRAQSYDEQPYDLIDQFVVRAIAEGRLTSGQEIAAFLGVSVDLVLRCVQFLTVIGHLNTTGGRLALTALGVESHRSGVRMVQRESRQDLLFESFTGDPLPREYYHSRVRLLSGTQAGSQQIPRYWHPVNPTVGFRPESLDELVTRSDRRLFNVPEHLLGLSAVTISPSFLPVYVIETFGHGLLAYTKVGEERDSLLENVFHQVPTMQNLVLGQRQDDPEEIWTRWLAEPSHGGGLLRQRPDGGWRSVMRASAFGAKGAFPIRDVGSFRTSRQHVIQLWSDDADLRSRALLERSLAIAGMASVRSRADLSRHVARLSALLELDPPSIDTLSDQAAAAGLDERADLLNRLE